MGGGVKVEDCRPCVDGPRTMVLVGRAGNGKSATANSIFGSKAFESKRSCEGVTKTTQCSSIKYGNGQVVNVIDTPGLFDNSLGSEYISKEIVQCIGLAGDGIDAVLLVYSTQGRFTEEEEAVIRTLQTFFGPKITDYMIVVFTGGDEVESLEDYFGQSLPKPLQEIFQVCKNRCVMFDNMTNDENKKALQLQKLMTLVENMIEENGGHPYTDNFFVEYKEAAMLQQKKEEVNASEGHTKQEVQELTEQIQKSHAEQLKRVTEMVEEKMKVTNDLLMTQLAAEKSARLKAEKAACDALKKSEDDAKKVKKQLAEAKSARVEAEKAACDARKKVKHWMDRAHAAEGRPQFCSIM